MNTLLEIKNLGMLWTINSDSVQKCLSECSMEYKLKSVAEFDGKSEKKVKKDTFVGQIGEMMWYTFLQSMNIPCAVPDFKQHDPRKSNMVREKLWDRDLPLQCNITKIFKNNREIKLDRHTYVKSQTLISASKFKPSIFIQKRHYDEKKRKYRKEDNILNSNRNVLFLFALIDAPEDLFSVNNYNGYLSMGFWPTIKKYFLNEPFLKKYSDKKYAVYLEKLKNNNKLIIDPKEFFEKNIIIES